MTNQERALLHTAAVLVYYGNINECRVDEDGTFHPACWRDAPFTLDASSGDDRVALVSLMYLAANLIKFQGVDPIDAIDHLVEAGVRGNLAKKAVKKVSRGHDRKYFSLVWDIVRPVYIEPPDGAPTAIAGGS